MTYLGDYTLHKCHNDKEINRMKPVGLPLTIKRGVSSCVLNCVVVYYLVIKDFETTCWNLGVIFFWNTSHNFVDITYIHG